ncbi:uncharacterized protein GGS22DRAFT_159459 [Annulohypoxylon maeteangense]|uniref:uncharacterized protein n=1 Tax=Annulohypoxylon maeteangense TaxID=1927788 RepID=UPI002007A619|nr:uncharacterized protein GGS22DRAFT_159459 [Annulohypoxylon maeteangense]KAI0885960.1 hypothetical protein GGS22DRAFT_159459 [Annulohypoxylon maeteangense]
MTSLLLGRPLGIPRFAPYLLTLRRCVSDGSPYRGNLGREGILSLGLGSGDHIRLVSKQYQISLPNQNVFSFIPISRLKMNDNSCKFSIMISHIHVFDEASIKYLDSYEHPFAKSVLDMYIKKKKIPLWHKVFAHPVARPFPCKVAVKRIRHALFDALAYYGYDREGRKITKDESSVITNLYGTVKIACGDPKAVCNIKFADLLEQMKQVVAGFEPILAKDKNGEFITAPRPRVNKIQPKQTGSQAISRIGDSKRTDMRSNTRPARRM